MNGKFEFHPETIKLLIAVFILMLFGSVMFAVIRVISSETMLGIMLGALTQSVASIVGNYFRKEETPNVRSNPESRDPRQATDGS